MYNEKILVVDDDPIVLEMLRLRLRGQRYDVKEALHANVALDILNKEKIDLIVLDHMLPDISGLELCKKLKKTDNLKEIPIIIFSCCNTHGFESECEKAGALELISKTDFSELFVRLSEILRG